MNRTSVEVSEDILGHLARFPHLKLTAYELARVLEISPSSVRRACLLLYAAAKVWKLESAEAIRYQISPSYLRKLDSRQGTR